MSDYDTSSLGRGIFAGLSSYADAVDEQKTRAREFKALQEFADATGIAGKDQTTVMDLESLKGFVRGAESKRAIAEQQRKAQMDQAQFAEQQKQHQIINDRNRTLDMQNAGQRSFENDRQLGADQRAEGEFGLRKDIHTDTLARFAAADAEKKQAQAAVGGFLKDFNRLSGDPQFNGTGMQRPVGQFEAYRSALGLNPGALSPQMIDNLGTMSVAEDRQRAQSSLAAFSPDLKTKSVTLGDGRIIEIPYGTTSAGGAHWMPDLVKPRPGDGTDEAAPPDPVISPDGKLLWDARTRSWKQMRNNAGDAIEKLFPKAGGAAVPAGAATERKAEGGYIVGRVYGGKKYLGGSPTTAGNWETVR